MNRKAQQAELLFKVGQLFGPLLKLAENPTGYDAEERRRICARFFRDRMPFLTGKNGIHEFTEGEPGHSYPVQWRLVHDLVMNTEWTIVSQKAVDPTPDWYGLIHETVPKVLETILSIPVPVDSTIHEATTPFSTYCLVKDLCSTTSGQIIWMDRYFDQSIFHRYFSKSIPGTTITLITYPHSECKGKNDEKRYDEFMDMSKLFAAERGPDHYRLITDDQFHDRWLRCDDKLFVLGGSIKDIDRESVFTISRLDPTPHNFDQFDEPVKRGFEVFGPHQTTHP